MPEGLDINVFFGYYSILGIFALVYSNLLPKFQVYRTLHKHMNLNITNQPLSRLVFKFFRTKKSDVFVSHHPPLVGPRRFG